VVDHEDWAPLQRHAAAYHEAGHAVVAAAHGYDLYQIDADGMGKGVVWFSCPDTEDEAEDGRCRLLSVDVAGRVAQSIAQSSGDAVSSQLVQATARMLFNDRATYGD
jgi:hypothetical protein